ncbi:MAG: DUF1573 domain-containing protein [Lewinellaceae bacterium]|nr:DUF1573 domain-containing protein [Lewinellaceae bacterium]
MMKSLLALPFLILLVHAGHLYAQEMKIGDPTQNSGKVEWKPMQIRTGTIPFGIPHEENFEVKNVSTDNLVILEVKSGCHCTVVDWSKEPIPPGKSGSIRITYDALKEGEFYKIIAVTTNFDPEHGTGLSMTGTVLPKK